MHRIWPVTSRLAGIHRLTILRKTHIIAVVGPLGKTTTTHCTIAALGDCGRGLCPGNSQGPLACSILGYWPDGKSLVQEIGIDGTGQMSPLAKTIRPNIAVVTSIGREHNRSLGNLENARNEKADMVRILGASDIAVLNGDDPNVLWMATQTQAKIITYGVGEANQIRASGIRINWPHGTSFLVSAHGDTRQYKTRLIGRHDLSHTGRDSRCFG